MWRFGAVGHLVVLETAVEAELHPHAPAPLLCIQLERRLGLAWGAVQEPRGHL